MLALRRWIALFAMALPLTQAAATLAADGSAAAAPSAESSSGGETATQNGEAPFTLKRVRGKVVYLVAAVQRRFGVKAVPEARERILALQTPDGRYRPLFEDVRGRSFRKDKRLRGIDLELLVRQYEGSPLLHVIQVFALEDGKKYELDYWCDICAIAMFELKACDCCQGPIELRRRLVEEK